MAIPKWHAKGDWFDVCSCNLPCPCEFGQPASNNRCEGVLAYHITEGKYGDVSLDDLSVVVISGFYGDLWTDDELRKAKISMGLYIDDRADEEQQEAIKAIFSGEAGGWQAIYAELTDKVIGIELAPIEFKLDEDLKEWHVRVGNTVEATAEALTGPTTREGALVQLTNPPGSEVGPIGFENGDPPIATWARGTRQKVDAFGFNYDLTGVSSKHLPFYWTGDAS